jgi:phosphoserine phosphatase RsbU/P
MDMASKPAPSTELARTVAPLRLVDFVDLPTLQAFQDGFAKLTGIATTIRDAEGTPLTQPSGISAFCDIINSTASGAEACRMGHVSASKSVLGSDAASRHRCHAGLTQFVAPIVVEGRQLGAIIMGDRPAGALVAGSLKTLAKEHGLDAAQLQIAAGDLQPWSEEELSLAASIVQQLANTIARLCYQAFELRRRVDELAAVHQVSSALAGRMKLQEILDTVTQELVRTMGLRAAGIRLLDEDTGELRMASAAYLKMDYVDTNPIYLEDSPIDAEVLDSGHTLYVEDIRTDPRTLFKERARREGLVSALLTPLASGGKRLGVLRAYMGQRHRFTPYDISLLEAIASQAAAAIVNARLRRDAADAERLERQVRLAGDVQRRMIPAHPPKHPFYQFGCVYEPTMDLGGDFYDFIQLPGGDIGLVIADVVGKGVPASLTMAGTRSALRSHAAAVSGIPELMCAVNQRLCADTLPGEFVTALWAILDRDQRRITYCNAGHEPLLLLRRGVLHTFDAGGLVLGVEPTATYESQEIALEPDDLIVLSTDGIVEATDYRSDAYGRERLHSSIKLHGAMAPDLPITLVAKQLFWDVRRYVGLAPQSDDMTLVVIRVT